MSTQNQDANYSLEDLTPSEREFALYCLNNTTDDELKKYNRTKLEHLKSIIKMIIEWMR